MAVCWDSTARQSCKLIGPGEVNGMHGFKPHWLKTYEIQRQSYLGQVPEWLKTMGPKADQLWAALEWVGPALLREFFRGRRL